MNIFKFSHIELVCYAAMALLCVAFVFGDLPLPAVLFGLVALALTPFALEFLDYKK
jgi:hypothetical protein